MTIINRRFFSITWNSEQHTQQLFSEHQDLLDDTFDKMINNEIPPKLSGDTHLDEARKESGFLNPICNMEKLEDREQLAETHHKADRVESVC